MKKQNKLDQWLLASVAGLIIMGLMSIYSATNGTGDTSLFYRQLAWALFGITVATFVFYNDGNIVRNNSYIFYAIGLLMLIAVLIFGRKIAGQTSWMKIGFFSFQPSEVVKMATILALARYLSDDNTDIKSIPHLFIALAIAFIPMMLIMLQPDMGTMLTILPFIATMLIMAGFDIYILMLLMSPFVLMIAGFFNIYIVIALAVILGIILLVTKKQFKLHQLLFIGSGLAAGLLINRFSNEILKPHQIKRIQTFIDPMSDPQGAGYNALQAKIAISSGGLLGKGFLAGTQTQLRFIPAQWTDFIFCVIAEELGFIGASLLIALYLTLILRLIGIINSITNKFVQLTLGGFVSLMFVHVVINIGMTIGLIPVIGVPLPFVSYGGSSLLGNMIMVGLALNFFSNKRNLGYHSSVVTRDKWAP
ncbi:MAG: rod shape-determining protein RodA [Chlorobium sp.]|nr:MAG: rod shape-determining protein RodA [Chlorobium sp.]